MITRRALWLVCAGMVCAASLSGCGFHPVYGAGQPAQAELAAVYVNIIPNRSGQLLRQALQAKLEGRSADVPKRYALAVSYGESVQSLDTQADNSTTRNRAVGTATWTLHAVDNPAVRLAGGTVRSVDGYNIIDEQFFYSDLSQDAVEHRLADALAGEITLGLSLYFDKHLRGG
jgi:LPS-assembly lipoprotein